MFHEVDGSSLTVAEFERFFRLKQPVLIRGALGGAAALQWSPRDLATAFSRSQAHVSLCAIPYPDDWMPPNVARAARREGKVQDVFAGDLGYIFQEVEEGTELAERLATDVSLAALLPGEIAEHGAAVMLPQLSVGQSGTGAPWHWHQDALNACLVGERAWYLRPPACALMSRTPVREGIPEAGTSLYTTQRPGDVLYIPELWAHTALNRVLSVAVSLEFGSIG